MMTLIEKLGYEISEGEFFWTFENPYDGKVISMSKNHGVVETMFTITQEELVALHEWWKEYGRNKKFDLADYRCTLYAMHCDTEEKARKFCDYLNSCGKRWYLGGSYRDHTHYNIYEHESYYCFNTGTLVDFDGLREDGYIPLEYDDFDWSEN